MTSEVLRPRMDPEGLGRKDSDTSTASGAWGRGLGRRLPPRRRRPGPATTRPMRLGKEVVAPLN
jgi:hypothetical protein